MILVFAESYGGKIKKAAQEALTYGAKLSGLLGQDCVAVCIGAAEGIEGLGKYGAKALYHIPYSGGFDAQVYANLLSQAAEKLGAKTIVLSHTSTGKSLAGRVAIRCQAALVSAATSLPELSGESFLVKKNVFSGKGIATYQLSGAMKVISIAGNTFRPEVIGAEVSVQTLALTAPASRVRVKQVETVSGGVPLPEADIVVSAGRGMKGPEHWGIIEELADTLGAATACSRPVADVHWRPHHEHVGQTGVAIRPTLYFAIGISGAIQHLAGVNQSKVIVVINKDPEAPFFKAADYGIVGDLFDVVPKLNQALKAFKASQH